MANQGLEFDEPNGEKLIQKLNKQKFQIIRKIGEEKSYRRRSITDSYRYRSVNFVNEWQKYDVIRLRKEMDFLEHCIEKMSFANNAYQGRPIRSSLIKQDVDKHKLNFQMVHGQKSSAEEKRLAREIKSNQQTAIVDSFISRESLKYTSWWYYHPAYDNRMNKNDPKAVEDRLRKLKTDDLEKEIIIANATVKGKIWNALGSKKALQDELQEMRTKYEKLVPKHTSASNRVQHKKKQVKDVDKEINYLTKQLKDTERRINLLNKEHR